MKKLLSIILCFSLLLTATIANHIMSVSAEDTATTIGTVGYPVVDNEKDDVIISTADDIEFYNDFTALYGFSSGTIQSAAVRDSSTTALSYESTVGNFYGGTAGSLKAELGTATSNFKPAGHENNSKFAAFQWAKNVTIPAENVNNSSFAFWVKAEMSVNAVVHLFASSGTVQFVSEEITVPAGISIIEIPLANFIVRSGSVAVDTSLALSHIRFGFRNNDGTAPTGKTVYIDNIGYYLNQSNGLAKATHHKKAVVLENGDSFDIAKASVWPTGSSITLEETNIYGNSGKSLHYNEPSLDTTTNTQRIALKTNYYLKNLAENAADWKDKGTLAIWVKANRAVNISVAAAESTTSVTGTNCWQTEFYTVPAGESVLRIPLSEFNTKAFTSAEHNEVKNWSRIGFINLYLQSPISNTSALDLYIDEIAIEYPIIGDINDDGDVNILDLFSYRKVIDNSLLAPYYVADVNADCKENIEDMQAIRRSILGLEEYNIPNKDYGEFSADTVYEMSEVVSAMPNTFEAWINVDNSVDTESIIIGNTGFDHTVTTTTPQMEFGIRANGRPFVQYITPDGYTNSAGNYAVSRLVVSSADCDIRGKGWTHVVYTRDAVTGHSYFYINGVLAHEYTGNNEAYSFKGNMEMTLPFVVGGNVTVGNSKYFKGMIGSLAMYSDLRTADEIEADMLNINLSDSDLLAAYDFAATTDKETIFDESTNKNDLRKDLWHTEAESIGDYDYSFAVVGDTQTLLQKYPSNMTDIYQYIADNSEALKIKHVFGLGDIVETDVESEWQTAKSAIDLINVPYSLIRGNHDIFNLSENNWFDAYFGSDSNYANQETLVSNYPAGSYVNTAHVINTGYTDYLVLALDYGASDDVISWAGSLLDSDTYKNYKVIVTTHSYQAKGGELSAESNTTYVPSNDENALGDNNGAELYEQLIKNYSNIVMVLSGHDSSDRIVWTRSTEGTIQMLIDPQGMDKVLGACGMVAMFYVNEEANTVEVRYYSTVKKAYYKYSNQFSISDFLY